jgi:hypothetical protein
MWYGCEDRVLEIPFQDEIGEGMPLHPLNQLVAGSIPARVIILREKTRSKGGFFAAWAG